MWLIAIKILPSTTKFIIKRCTAQRQFILNIHHFSLYTVKVNYWWSINDWISTAAAPLLYPYFSTYGSSKVSPTLKEHIH